MSIPKTHHRMKLRISDGDPRNIFQAVYIFESLKTIPWYSRVKGLRKIRNILKSRKIKLQPPVTCGWQLKPGKEPTTLTLRAGPQRSKSQPPKFAPEALKEKELKGRER